jgi:predicted ATP-dependent endonuclease of OLD family
MKITKLHIEQFRHLENLEFDFTYKSGLKKGQPLEKICLIGQSATGKTSLLEFIANIFYRKEENKTSIQNIKGKACFKDYNSFYTYNNNFFEISKKEYDKISNKIMNIRSNTITTNKGYNDFLFSLNNPVVFYFTSEILSKENYSFFVNEKKDYNTPKIIGKIDLARPNHFIKNNSVLEFNSTIDRFVLNEIFKDINDFRAKLTQKGSDLINRGLHANYKNLEREMEAWKKENPNPLIDLAEKCLNPILKRLNLEVDIVDTSVPIPLKPINEDKPVPVNALSTGTKQLLLNALPLYKLDTDDTIILIDEPERSLYPDIQIELMDYYKNLAPNAQFIVATHSPFIAAAFEPEERFILYFGEDGKVKVKNGVSPIGDDPNDMLKNDFMVNYYNHFGDQAYKKYIELKQKVANEKDEIKKKELILEVVKLGDEYNF